MSIEYSLNFWEIRHKIELKRLLGELSAVKWKEIPTHLCYTCTSAWDNTHALGFEHSTTSAFNYNIPLSAQRGVYLKGLNMCPNIIMHVCKFCDEAFRETISLSRKMWTHVKQWYQSYGMWGLCTMISPY